MSFWNQQRNRLARSWQTPGILAVVIVLVLTVSGVIGVFGPPAIAFTHLPWQLPTGQKTVALTFDDGPNSEATRQIVDILQRLNVPATFFMVGKSVAADPTTTKYVADHGFTIGNHSWDHSWDIISMNQAQVEQELTSTNQAIFAATGRRPSLMRWPHGQRGHTADQWAESLGLQPVNWQVDPGDYATNNPDLLVQRTLDMVHDGDILLLHDNLQDGQFARQLHGRQATIAALPRIISGLRAKGFTFVALPKP